MSAEQPGSCHLGKGHALYAGVLAVLAADDIVHHLASLYLIYVPATGLWHGTFGKIAERHVDCHIVRDACRSLNIWSLQTSSTGKGQRTLMAVMMRRFCRL